MRKTISMRIRLSGLARLAREEGRSQAEVLCEAVATYQRCH